MKIFLIILMVLAVLFAIYEGILFVIDIRKKIVAKRLKKRVDKENDKNNSAVKE